MHISHVAGNLSKANEESYPCHIITLLISTQASSEKVRREKPRNFGSFQWDDILFCIKPGSNSPVVLKPLRRWGSVFGKPSTSPSTASSLARWTGVACENQVQLVVQLCQWWRRRRTTPQKGCSITLKWGPTDIPEGLSSVLCREWVVSL